MQRGKSWETSDCIVSWWQKNQSDGPHCSLTWQNKHWVDFRLRWEFVALLTQGIPLFVLTEDIFLSDIPPYHGLVFPDWEKVLRNTWKWVIVMIKEWKPEASISEWCRMNYNEKTETKHLGHRMKNPIKSFSQYFFSLNFQLDIFPQEKTGCKCEALGFE